MKMCLYHHYTLFYYLPLPVKQTTKEFTILRSLIAGIQVCTVKLIENNPPVNHNKPTLRAFHSLPRIDVPIF
jgi:hypothetical protein